MCCPHLSWHKGDSKCLGNLGTLCIEMWREQPGGAQKSLEGFASEEQGWEWSR